MSFVAFLSSPFAPSHSKTTTTRIGNRHQGSPRRGTMAQDTPQVQQQEEQQLSRHCIICLESPVLTPSSPPSARATAAIPAMGNSSMSTIMTVCPLNPQHIICHRNHCLDDLALFNVAPERLRIYHGMVPCPSETCIHQWQYRDLEPSLSAHVRPAFVEGLVGFLKTTTLAAGMVAAGEGQQQSRVSTSGQGTEETGDDIREDDPRIHNAVQHILSSIFNLRCPYCQTVFFDFDACCAVNCASCGVTFCGLCLEPSATTALIGGAAAAGGLGAGQETGGLQQQRANIRDQAHTHVITTHGNLFFNDQEIRRQQNVFRYVTSTTIPHNMIIILFIHV